MTPQLVKQVVAPDGDMVSKMRPRVYSQAALARRTPTRSAT